MSTNPCETIEREANGQFAKGNKGGPGNPFGRRLAANRAAVVELIGPEQITAIMQAQLHKACDGDLAAAKFIMQYAVGKPAAVREPDLVDVEAFEVAKQKRVPHAHAVTAMIDMPIEEATAMAGSTPEPEFFEYFRDPEKFMREAAGYELVEEEAPREWTQRDEAYRIVGYFLHNGDFPPDSPFTPLPDGASPEAVAEHRRMLAEFKQALTEGKWPTAESPINPSSDGAASTGERKASVSAA